MDNYYNLEREKAIGILKDIHKYETDMTNIINEFKEKLEDKVHNLPSILEEFSDYINPHEIPEWFLIV